MKRSPLQRRTGLKRAGIKPGRVSRRREPGEADEYQDLREATARRAGGLCELDGMHSAGCRRDSGRGSQAHHVRPRSDGGADELTNLLWVHADCHMNMHGKDCDQGRRFGYLRDRVWRNHYVLGADGLWIDQRNRC